MPGQKSPDGHYCLQAAIQSSYSCTGAEAGITAFEQLLLKHQGQNLFRQGALVNVIFVSDTHDPGINNNTLKNNIKSFTELLTLAQTDNAISGLKFHALAPESQCNSEQMWGFSYNTLSMASGGYAVVQNQSEPHIY